MRYSISILILFYVQMSNAQPDSTAIKQLLDKAYSLEANEPLLALKVYKKAHHLSVSKKYHLDAFKALQYSGIVHSDLSNYDSAIYYFKKAIPFCQLLNYKKGIASTYINIGNAFQFQGKLDSVVSNYTKGIKVFETIKDSSNIAQSYANLATLFGSINQFEKQKSYLVNALKLTPKTNPLLKGYILNDLGQVFLKTNKTSEALEYFTKVYDIGKSIDNSQLLFFSTRNFGEYYVKTKAYDKAISYYEKALQIVENLNEDYYKNDLLLQLGETYLLINNKPKAISYLNQALTFGEEKEILTIQMKAHKKLSAVYENDKNFDSAFSHLNKYTKLKDTVLNIEHLKRINELENQYQAESKDKEIIETQNALQQNELDLAKKKNQFLLAVVSGTILLIVLFGSLYFYKQRQKLKNVEIAKLEQERDITKLQALIEGEEKERKRIAQDLHDGINGDLSVIKYKITTINQVNFNNNEKGEFKSAINMLDNAIEQVRHISHNLAPPSLQNFKLIEAVKQYCFNISETNNLQVDFNYFGEFLILKEEIETAIYRIIQELINNIVKHAQATEAMVQINDHNNTINITVEDNGFGFDNTKKASGLGLKNIKSRVTFLKGDLKINSDKNGTIITIDIDLDKLV